MQVNWFRNVGYITKKLEDSEIIEISAEVEKIKQDFTKAIPENPNLIGQIKNEYRLEDSRENLKQVLIPLVEEFERNFNYIKSIKYGKFQHIIDLDNTWVNFQKKYEFNPSHDHQGVYSFVIWYDIPYLIEDERKNSPGINANTNLAGEFEFTFLNSIGDIMYERLPIDKTWNKTICLFPSQMKHAVYPFYSSDEYRITIAGNIGLKG